MAFLQDSSSIRNCLKESVGWFMVLFVVGVFTGLVIMKVRFVVKVLLRNGWR